MPARGILEKEKIFVMDEERAIAQDIRPLNILILNLMPEKQKTEVQLLRLLGNTPLQVNVSFLHMETHESKNVSKSHLEQFYTTFSAIKEKYFDGMIITGAPIEHLPFESVTYWDELKDIMEWTKNACHFRYAYMLGSTSRPLSSLRILINMNFLRRCSGVYSSMKFPIEQSNSFEVSTTCFWLRILVIQV